jgi:starch synthase
MDNIEKAFTDAEFGPIGAASGSLRRSTRLLFVTSEMADFIKAGGLGDVSASLPRKLRGLCDVRVLIPGFPNVRSSMVVDVVKSMPATAGLPAWSLGRSTTEDGLTIYSILCDELYDRHGSPYGPHSGGDYLDNDIRFARLSLAAAEIAAGEADPNWKPDILHLNDWPSALAPAYMHWKGTDTPSILTIHNLAYQGLFDPTRMGNLAIPDHSFAMNGVEFHGQISFLKSGIFYSSHVTTVSETYAREITTDAQGCGLQGLLRTRMDEGRLHGIVNGIDDSWSVPSALEAGGDILRWKESNAAEIRDAFELEPTRGPLFSIISRLVHQKGIDLSIETAEMIVADGGQLVVIGQGDPKLEAAISTMAKRHPGSIGARIGFDESEARKLFAASDFLLMPSRFEPCGLSQMYAQRSGSLPIAHRTGGLADTIEDGRSGFLFSSLNVHALKVAVFRAFGAFHSKKNLQNMRKHAMGKTFDWTLPTARYADVYASALNR